MSLSQYNISNEQELLSRPDSNIKDGPIGDKFWMNDISILFQKNRLVEFFPNYEMTLIEKLNAIVRMSVYVGLTLYVISKKYIYLYLPIIIMGFTIFIFKNQQENMELYYNSYKSNLNNKNYEKLVEKPYTKPTTNNPFMNINLVSDPKNKTEAIDSWDNKLVQEDIEKKFDHNLYRDVSDLFGKNNSQREYYTMPSTTIPNKQTEFAKWCYKTGPTCKESSINCTSPWSPVQSTSDAYKYVPKNF